MSIFSKKTDLTNIVRLFLLYLVIQFGCALVYFIVWKHNPCSFLFNEDFNGNPIGTTRSALWGEINSDVHINKPTTSLLLLEQQMATLFKDINENKNEQSLLECKMDKIKEAEKDISDKNAEYRNKQIYAYKQKELRDYLEDIKEKQEFIDLLEGSSNSESSYPLALKVANAKVDLANSKLKYSKKNAEVQSYIVDNMYDFSDSRLVKQLHELNDEFISTSDSIIDMRKKDRYIYKKLNDLWTNSYKIRVSRLNYLDFAYFSLITATTTGYGDITPNNSWVRLIVSVQIILSLIMIGKLINKIARYKKAS